MASSHASVDRMASKRRSGFVSAATMNIIRKAFGELVNKHHAKRTGGAVESEYQRKSSHKGRDSSSASVLQKQHSFFVIVGDDERTETHGVAGRVWFRCTAVAGCFLTSLTKGISVVKSRDWFLRPKKLHRRQRLVAMFSWTQQLQ